MGQLENKKEELNQLNERYIYLQRNIQRLTNERISGGISDSKDRELYNNIQSSISESRLVKASIKKVKKELVDLKIVYELEEPKFKLKPANSNTISFHIPL